MDAWADEHRRRGARGSAELPQYQELSGTMAETPDPRKP